MGWDASFSVTVDGQPLHVADWNYTHNCNGMANDVLGDEELRAGALRWWGKQNRPDVAARVASGEMRGSWWECLHGLSGKDGATLLKQIVDAFWADRTRFRAMNPENGWGDFDSFCDVLEEMRAASEKFPSGTWRTSG